VSLSTFVRGQEFNRRFFREAVGPILRSNFPRLRYSAALLGPGSEVLGYDTELSRDHDWGPRAQLFLSQADCRKLRRRIVQVLRRDLPRTFDGLSTRFTTSDADKVQIRVKRGQPRGTPIVWIGTIRGYFRSYFHVDPDRELTELDWLVLPSQKLLSVAAGPVYRDDLGLSQARAKFRYYPRDVWLHLLSVQWLRIAEEEAFVGRTWSVRDGLGSRLITARQVREMMRLAFLLERTYYPYDKWIGTAFLDLRLAASLGSHFERALGASSQRARENALSGAYEILAKRQNSLRITPPLPTAVSRFHQRPYLVIHAGDFAAAVRSKIRNRKVRQFARLGSIDQFGDTEELGSRKEQLGSLRALLRS
jgi:hypothetical protein